MKHQKVWVDCHGSASGKIAYILKGEAGNVLVSEDRRVEPTTEPVAEYQAIINGLTATSYFTQREVVVTSESLLIVKQLSGEFQLKDEKLRPFFNAVKNVERMFDKVAYYSAGGLPDF